MVGRAPDPGVGPRGPASSYVSSTGPVTRRTFEAVNRPLRLLILVNVYRPDLGGGVLFADLAEGLAARGLDVTVRCAVPYYPEWSDKSGTNGLEIQTGTQNGVRVERFGLFIPSRPNALGQRLAYEASFLLSLARRLPSPGEFDAIMVFCPLVGAVAWAAVLKRVTGAPLWLNVQDLSADAAAASGIVQSARAARLMATVQRWLFNRADAWSSISPVMVERLECQRRRDQPVHLLPNWLHRSLADLIAALPERPGRTTGVPRLLYSGNIGTKQDLLRLCESLHRSPVPFRFRIQGAGGMAPVVRSWVETSGDDRFEFGDLTDEAGLAAALRAADLFVVTETEGAGGSFIPSKLLPAMAAGTPVLAVCDADSPFGREMEESGIGPVFRWSGIDGIPALLTDLSERPDVFDRWRAACRDRSLRYDAGRIIDEYARLLSRLAARPTGRDFPDEPTHPLPIP